MSNRRNKLLKGRTPHRSALMRHWRGRAPINKLSLIKTSLSRGHVKWEAAGERAEGEGRPGSVRWNRDGDEVEAGSFGGCHSKGTALGLSNTRAIPCYTPLRLLCFNSLVFIFLYSSNIGNVPLHHLFKSGLQQSLMDKTSVLQLFLHTCVLARNY